LAMFIALGCRPFDERLRDRKLNIIWQHGKATAEEGAEMHSDKVGRSWPSWAVVAPNHRSQPDHIIDYAGSGDRKLRLNLINRFSSMPSDKAGLASIEQPET
jgi:hypothetical protein